MKFASVLLAAALALPSAAAARPKDAAIDAYVAQAMVKAGSQGLALAVIDDGRVAYVKTYGKRNAKGDPLTPDTVMYGASLTKAVFAWTVLQMVDDGLLDLDRPIAEYLPKPLPEYAGQANRYSAWDTLSDERWRKITPRILLTHSGGFANFYWLEPDRKLRIHFDPGSRYAYSGDGLILLQFAIEQGLGLDLGQEMQRRVFDRYGMKTSSMIWRPDFATNLADGWDKDGKPEPHDERGKVRAAGSLDTTISDLARFSAAVASGEGLSPKMRAEFAKAQLPITTATQFPPLQDELPPAGRKKGLAAGLGVVTFEGPQGRGFFKGGHNDVTGNTWACVEKTRDCVVLLSNDVRSETVYADLVRFILGDAGVPYDWEYGDQAGK